MLTRCCTGLQGGREPLADAGADRAQLPHRGLQRLTGPSLLQHCTSAHLALWLTHAAQAYREAESPWLMPVLIAIAHNYRTVAAAADRPQLAAGKAPTALEACGSQLQKYFSLAMGRTGKTLSCLACQMLRR